MYAAQPSRLGAASKTEKTKIREVSQRVAAGRGTSQLSYYILAVQYPRRESRENDSQLPNHSAQTPCQHKCHNRSLGNESPTGRPQNRTGNLCEKHLAKRTILMEW